MSYDALADQMRRNPSAFVHLLGRLYRLFRAGRVQLPAYLHMTGGDNPGAFHLGKATQGHLDALRRFVETEEELWEIDRAEEASKLRDEIPA